MKIYTEVIYTWDDNKGELVEESSKSYDYEGEIVQCISIGGYTWNPPTYRPPTITIDIPTITIPDIDIPTVDDIQDTITDVTGDDPIGQFQDDWEEQSDAAEDSINETVADTMDTGQSNLEGLLEDNNDSATQAEDTINSNISDLNAFNDNLTAVLGDTGSLINQGMGAILDINNPNSLISSPQNWYESAAGVGRGGWSLDWLEEAQNEYLTDQLVGGLAATGTGPGMLFGYDLTQHDDEGGGGGGTDPGAAMYSGNRTLHGDPFASPSNTRRLIQDKQDFATRLKKDKNLSPSLINA